MKTLTYSILTLSIMIGFSACGSSSEAPNTHIATKTIRALGVDLQWQSEVDAQKNWQDAQDYCQEKGMRLPTPREFFALLDTNQSIDTLFPSDIKEFWTNASYSDTKAWKITTWSSTQSYHDKNQTLGVRCLKGPTLDTHTYTKENNAFIDKNDQTAQEKRWQDEADTSINRLTYAQANNYCHAKDMRLPTLFELQEILESSPTFLAKDDFLSYWSTTPLPTDSNSMMTVNFTTGGVLFSDKSANNHLRCVQDIDKTAPVITLNGQAEITLHQDANYLEAGASARDERDGDVTVTISGSVDTSHVGDYTLSYEAIDKAGNHASISRVIHIVDVTLPTLTLNGSASLVLNEGESYSELGAVAQDNVDTNLSVEITGSVDTTTPGHYTLTYTTQDSAGNKISITREVSVLDITPPVITLLGDDTLTLNQGESYHEAGASAIDNVDGSVSVTTQGHVDTSTAGNYSITYTATDTSGNSAQKTRTITIKDTTKPTITLNGSTPQTLYLGDNYIEAGATASDNVAVSGTIMIDKSTLDTNTVGTYTVTYTISDTSGNQKTITRVVNVIDNSKPIITLHGKNPQIVEVKTAYTELGASANDDGDGDITSAIMIDTSDVNTTRLGTYQVRYNVTNSSNHAATEMIREVRVEDTTAPNISLLGDANITINQNDTYTEAGATATDNYDTNITITTNNPVNTSKVGSYTITYTATDSSGNKSSKQRTVIVKDKTPPVINIGGANPLILEVNTPFIEPGVSAVDAIDGEVNVTSRGLADNSRLRFSTVTYSAKDKSGNGTSTTRTVHIVDTTKPVITLNGESSLTVEVNQNYIDAGATVHDNYDKALTVVTSGVINIRKLGTYTLYFDVNDSSGNSAIQKTRTIIVQDTTPPTLALNGEATITIDKGTTYTDAGASAMDNYDGDISSAIMIVNPVDKNSVGTYTITYNVSDSSGNNATQLTRTVIVQDPSSNTAENIIASLNNIKGARIADMDNDGDTDIVVLSANGLSWYENSGDIKRFVKHENIYSENFTSDAKIHDFNLTDTDGDHLLDINFSMQSNSDYIVTCLNNSSHNFTCSSKADSNPTQAIILKKDILTDIDNDGDSDTIRLATNKVIIDENLTTPTIISIPRTGDSADGQHGGIYNFSRDNTHEIVSDALTNLMWQDDSNAKKNVTNDLSQANNRCQALTLGGFSDWRLPNRYELYFLAQKNGTTLNGVFQNISTSLKDYWTSSAKHLYVRFSLTAINIARSINYTRCVRGEPISFKLIRDDNKSIVIDKKHALMWDDAASAKQNSATWDDAKVTCENLSISGYSDWRLPNVHELFSLFDDDGLNKAFHNRPTETLISATSDTNDNSKAYAIDKDGLDTMLSKNSNVIFRCVRTIP